MLEVRVGIEPTNKGFADPCLTTWLPHQAGVTINIKLTRSVRRSQIRKRAYQPHQRVSVEERSQWLITESGDRSEPGGLIDPEGSIVALEDIDGCLPEAQLSAPFQGTLE